MKKGDILVVQGAVVYTFLVTKQCLGVIEKNQNKIEAMIEKCNKKIVSEIKRIEKEKEGNSAQMIMDMQANLQRKKAMK